MLTKDEARIKRGLEQRWTKLVYEGLWFSPAREAIDAFVDRTQELVDGDVRVELRPNAAVVTGRRSPNMLYAETLASYGTGETFPHAAAEGFIRIASLGGASSQPPARGEDRGMTLWAGRVGRALDPAVCGVPPRATTPSSCRTTARRRPCTRGRLHAAGLLDDGRARRGGELGSPRSPLSAGSSPRTRTSTSRSSGCSARSGGRSTPADRATTRSLPRSGSTSPTHAPRRARRSAGSRARCSTAPRPRRRRRCRATRTSSAPSP